MEPSTTTAPDEQLPDRIRDYFGFRKFRPGQAEAVNSALQGRDTLVVMPTGSGKSLCFQLIALALEGITVVVSPLISLMKDQVDTLLDNGVWAVGINGTLTPLQQLEAASDIALGRAAIVYATPERLADPRVPRNCSRPGKSSCSSSMRLTVSVSGATTFAPTTWPCARPSTTWAGRPSWP